MKNFKNVVLSYVRFFVSGLSVAVFLLAANFAMAVPVNVNSADADTIADALAGIGPKTAEKIVSYRQANGSFTRAEDLLMVKGIGKKKLAKIIADVRLNSAGAAKSKPKLSKIKGDVKKDLAKTSKSKNK